MSGPDLFEKLQRTLDPVEIVDADGRLLGYYAPAATKSDWLRPTVSDEDARKKYPQGFKTPKPYLRIVDIA